MPPRGLVADSPGEWAGLVTSGSPHDASSRHHNVVIHFGGQSALDLLQTELAVPAVVRALVTAHE